MSGAAQRSAESGLIGQLRPSFPLRWGRRSLTVGNRTLVMGVLNVTPDSFFDGGHYLDTDMAVKHGLELLDAGADIVDVGGESTRPGSLPVEAGEEQARVLPVIEELLKQSPEALISIDTCKAEVASAALERGAQVVNDISGLTFDPLMAGAVARHDAGLVVMHIQNRPADMQLSPAYTDVVEEVVGFLQTAISRAVDAGVPDRNIVVDPGIGFGKTMAHNLALLNRLDRLHKMGRPVMVGLSRKSFIGTILGAEPEERLAGSLGAGVAAALRGAHILRVHDVKASVGALRMADAICNGAAGIAGEQ
jgi:dihydropteroate synthase